MRQKKDHSVYHNAATVTIPTECLTTAPENANPTKKGAQEVCKLIGGSILARVSRV